MAIVPRKDLRDTETMTGRPKRCFSRWSPASTDSEASGRLLRKNPMPGSRISRSRAIPACSSRGARRLDRMQDHQPAAPNGQIGIDRRVRKAVDVVQVIDAALAREALHLGGVA